MFDKITQQIAGRDDINVGFFDNNSFVNWNGNTGTLIMPGGDPIPGHGERRGEIKFVDNWEKRDTISVVTEPDIGNYKITWFYDGSILPATV